MRPQRKKKSTKQKDFYYPKEKTKKKSEKGSQEKEIAQQVPRKLSKNLTLDQNLTVTNQDQATGQILNQAPKVTTAATQTKTNRDLEQSEILNELYTNPNFPSAYSGNVKKFILEKNSLSRHKRKVKVKKWRKVYVGGPFTAIQFDLIHYRQYSEANYGHNYILVGVDEFSRKNFVAAQKSATAEETAKNLDKIIGSMEFKPRQFSSDQGSEFNIKNSDFYDVIIKKYGMVVFYLKAPNKASICERFIRTLKSRIERHFTENKTRNWIDVLQKFSENLNNTVHSTIGIEPNKVTFKNRKVIYNRLYGSIAPPVKCLFKVNDKVRIPEQKNIFAKGYAPNWTEEIFTIIKVFNDGKVCFYNLKNSSGEVLPKKYYTQEINLVIKS
jgi:hypothetical protein